jgi:hypothetical protein
VAEDVGELAGNIEPIGYSGAFHRNSLGADAFGEEEHLDMTGLLPHVEAKFGSVRWKNSAQESIISSLAWHIVDFSENELVVTEFKVKVVYMQ